MAAGDAKQTPGILYLPESMKGALVSGLVQLRHLLNIITYRYFQRNDTIPDTPTPQMVTVLRGVVTEALKEGLL